MGRYLDVGQKGVHFEDVVREIKQFYIEKGYSEEEAERIARATAGKVFWHKVGKARGRKIISEALRRKFRRKR